RVTKDGRIWAVASVEDLDASIEVLFFPKTYELVAEQLTPDTVVAVRGRVNQRDNGVSVVGMDLAVLDISDDDLQADPPVVINLPVEKVTDDLVDELRSSLLRHQGQAPVQIRLKGRTAVHLLKLDDSVRVNTSSGFVSEMKALIGPDCLASLP